MIHIIIGGGVNVTQFVHIFGTISGQIINIFH